MRIRTTPLYNEMALSEDNNWVQSPLNQFSSILKSKYNIQLDRLEKREQHVVPPWWISPFTCFDQTLEDAVKQHDAADRVRYAFTLMEAALAVTY